MKHEARHDAIEGCRRERRLRAQSLLERDVETGCVDLRSCEIEHLRVTIEPGHFGCRARLLQEDRERCGAASDVEHSVARSERGLLHQQTLEAVLLQRGAQDWVVESRERLVAERRDVAHRVVP